MASKRLGPKGSHPTPQAIRSRLAAAKANLYFDYAHQVWVKDGVYQDCGHPESMDCGCFGRLHVGQRAS